MVTNRFCNIAISSLIVMGMTACSSDDPSNGGTQINSQADQISVLLNSTANRVTNYGNTEWRALTGTDPSRKAHR